jgi:hypothetical protein
MKFGGHKKSRQKHSRTLLLLDSLLEEFVIQTNFSLKNLRTFDSLAFPALYTRFLESFHSNSSSFIRHRNRFYNRFSVRQASSHARSLLTTASFV